MVTTDELRQAIKGHSEWLLVRGSGKSFPVLSDELDVTEDRRKLHFGWLDDAGFHVWRLRKADLNGSEISLDLINSFGRESEQLRLVPRTPAAEAAAEIARARLEKANEIAALIRLNFPQTKIRRVALNVENGRLAQIQFELEDKTAVAALADITAKVTPEILFTTSIKWLEQLATRKKKPIKQLWLICEKRQAKACQKLLALLTGYWRQRIAIVEIDRKNDPAILLTLSSLKLHNLWRSKAPKLVLPSSAQTTAAAAEIMELANGRIDLITSRQGETLRYNGLPFARVRSMMEQEKAWFGIGRERRLLTPENAVHLATLISELEANRSSTTLNKRHEYYRSAPEAWLESILRRNIQLLDGNLILSPLYNQFRSSNFKIDLLALRRDGRLVIIELKTQPDRAGIFQAADYWRKIELQRRRGILSAANLFEGREIADKPTLVYFVAPAWSFHREFELFARCLTAELELWRFELHQDWRSEIRVLSRVSYEGLTNL